MAIQKKVKLSDSIIEEIRGMVMRGELVEGSKLPNQNDFAEQLGVSRLSLREALHTLELMGLVQQRPKKGTIITNANPSFWQGTGIPSQFNDRAEVKSLLDAREILESGVAKYAVEMVTDDQISTLRDMLSKMDEVVVQGNLADYSTYDAQFHMLLAELAGNRYISGFYSQLLTRLTDIIQFGFEKSISATEKSVYQHRIMVDALEKRDSEAYISAVTDHINYVNKTVEKFYTFFK